MNTPLRGVIAAITTPVTASGEVDLARFLARADHLLANGCDGLNVLGPTGEATSFDAAAREALINAVSAAGRPVERMMVGTGAAAIADAVRLTKAAAANGFRGALVLPPFYYKPLSNAGVLRFFEALVESTAAEALPLYLYNFPALTGVAYTPQLVEALVAAFGPRIAGLKDSSGDLDYARAIAAISPQLDVFPSNEGALDMARGDGPFAGCISATANLNAPDCARAYHHGDGQALARAVAVRKIFEGLPLVPGVKAMVAHQTGDPEHARNLPPFTPLDAGQQAELLARYAKLASVEAVVS
jgi:4-hydroxy-tetrahydrodipicolinate synthase